MLVARLGFRRLLVAALVLGSGISFAQGLLPSFGALLTLRLVEGSSYLAIVVAAPTLIAQLSPDRLRPLAMTLWGTFFGVSFAVVAILGLPLVTVAGPQSPFIAHENYMLSCAVLLIGIFPRQRALPADVHGRFSLRRVVRMHLTIYRSPFIAAPAIGWSFYTLTFVACLTLLPTLVAPDARQTVAGLMPIAGIAVSMTFGVILMRWVQAYAVIMTGFSLALLIALGFLALPYDPVLCVLLLAVLGLVQGASFASVPQLNATDEGRAHANGAMAQTGNLGNSLGTPILLAIIALFGSNGVVVFLVAAFAAALGAHFLMAAARQRRF